MKQLYSRELYISAETSTGGVRLYARERWEREERERRKDGQPSRMEGDVLFLVAKTELERTHVGMRACSVG